jgi:hypothetical protein
MPFNVLSRWIGKGLLFTFFSPALAMALTPMDDYNSLVAGAEDAGYRDGAFARARFNQPAALALDGSGSQLFVADSGNHRIRVVYLDGQNRVETLAGAGGAGEKDGPFAEALFNRPSAMAFIPPDHLAVYDQGSGLLRLMDLKARRVTTLGLGGEGKTPARPTAAVWNLVYLPSDQSLYFSEPSGHRLERMGLKAQKISVVLSHDKRLAFPQALCVSGGRLYAAGRRNPSVYEVKSNPNGAPGPVSLVEAGKGGEVVALTESDGILYALQAGGRPLARVAPSYRPVDLATNWGFLIDNKNPGAEPLLSFDGQQPRGFIAVPGEPRRLLISGPGPGLHSIVSVKDYEFGKYWGARSVTQFGTLSDFDYPEAKPPKTFRILVVGNSRVVTAPAIIPDAGKNLRKYNLAKMNKQGLNSLRTNTFAKQLELMLNTQATLRGAGTHYEVLVLGHPGAHLQFFANEEVPFFAQKYGVDLVLGLVSSFNVEGFQDYYQKPLTPEGIPSPKADPEFLVRPWQDKIPSGAPRRLFESSAKKGLVRAVSPSQLEFAYFGDLLASGDGEIRDDLTEMIGHPLRLLSQKLASLPSKGGRPSFLLCFVPSRDNDDPDIHLYGSLKDRDNPGVEDYESFWRDLCERNGLNLLDLTEPFDSLETSYYPTSEACCHRHYTAYGNYLIASLLSYYLPSQKWISQAP